MSVFAIKNKKIKEHKDDLLVCEFCGKSGLKFSVYRRYVYIFTIPLFPIGGKSIKCECGNCGAECGETGKKQNYLSDAKTPAVMAVFIILLIAFFIFLAVTNVQKGNKKAEYIERPKAGDVYLIKDSGGGTVKYYFLKVKKVDAESVSVYHNELTYNELVTKIDPDDYFITNDEIEIYKEDLKEYFDKGIINDVIRNYDDSVNFANEKAQR